MAAISGSGRARPPAAPARRRRRPLPPAAPTRSDRAHVVDQQVQHHLERPVAADLVDRARAARTASSVAPESSSTPSPSSPARRTVFGPRAPTSSGGGWTAASPAPRRRADVAPRGADPLPRQQGPHRRGVLAQQRHRRRHRRTRLRHPLEHAVAEPGQEPAGEHARHRGDLHGGERRVAQRHRQQPDADLQPCDVQASAAAADAIPPSKNESSHSHSCATPASSAASATARSRSGGNCGRNTTPSSRPVLPTFTRGLAQAARRPVHCGYREPREAPMCGIAGEIRLDGGPPTSRPSPASPRPCTVGAGRHRFARRGFDRARPPPSQDH